MLKNISSLLFFFACFALLSGCYDVKIPTAYLPNPKEVKTEITGSWISVRYHSQPKEIHTQEVSGELIAIQADSFYVLTGKQLLAIEMDAIDTAILYLFRDQTGKYLITTGLLLLPNIVAAISYSEAAFLLFVIPLTMTGIFTSLIEGYGGSYKLIYPMKNSLEDFRKFARFPIGIPPEINKDELNLVTFKLKELK